MKRADMKIGMEVAVGSGSFPKRGVVLSPDVLPLMYHRGLGYPRGPVHGVPGGVNAKTTCTVALLGFGGEWAPEHVVLSQVKPWDVWEAEEREREKRIEHDRQRQAKAITDWLVLRDRIACLAEQVGLPVTRDTFTVTVDGTPLWDRHDLRDKVFPASIVEKLLAEIVALKVAVKELAKEGAS